MFLLHQMFRSCLLQELNFMHKPGSVNEVPVVFGPHEPRLEELMWEAARGEHDQSPWFTGLMQRLLEGKDSGELKQWVGGQIYAAHG